MSIPKVSDIGRGEFADEWTPGLRARRMAATIGLRAFALSVGILPSRYCDIENGKVAATDDERRIIDDGLPDLPGRTNLQARLRELAEEFRKRATSCRIRAMKYKHDATLWTKGRAVAYDHCAELLEAILSEAREG